MVMLYAVVPPWIASVILTMGAGGLLSGTQAAEDMASTLFVMPQLAVPLLLGALALATAEIFRRTGRLRADQWPLAGLVMCVAALTACFAVAIAGGDGYGGGFLWVWCLYSGYPIFVFACTAYGWSKTFR
jgi:hypothetical protein